MAHGGYSKRRVAERSTTAGTSRRLKGLLRVEKKPKNSSLKNQIRSISRMIRKKTETGSEDDALLDLSDDDFFVNGSSSDEADADDDWTDKSTKEPVSSAFGRPTSSFSSDEKNQKPYTTRVLMPPQLSRFASTSRTYSSVKRIEIPSSSNTSRRRSQYSHATTSLHTSQSSNLSSNSDAHKPKRKRRPKKKKQHA